MKKKFLLYLFYILFIFLLVGALFLNFNKKKPSNYKNITVAEVAHTIFYAPMYVAKNNGYFKDKKINMDLILTAGADKVSAALLSGDADIGLSGSEATIYVYNGKEKDYLKTFAQITQKDGSFLVSRKKYDNFKLTDLENKTIIGGRKAGMPEMTLEWILKENNIHSNIDTSIAFSAMSGAFISGIGDFVSLFEPTALELEKQGLGYVVLSIGELGGNVPYTSFSARKSYIKNNKELIKDFTLAIQEGLDFVHNNSDYDVALAIQKDFPDTSLEDLEKVIKRYRSIDAWPKTTKFSEESFNHLQDIMISNGIIKEKVSYNQLIYNE